MGKFRYFPDGLLPRETPFEPFRAERENSFVENVFGVKKTVWIETLSQKPLSSFDNVQLRQATSVQEEKQFLIDETSYLKESEEPCVVYQ